MQVCLASSLECECNVQKLITKLLLFNFGIELTQAYRVLSNVTSRRDYDKEIGAYYLIRSSPKKRGGEKVLRLTDDVMELHMGDIEQVCWLWFPVCLL